MTSNQAKRVVDDDGCTWWVSDAGGAYGGDVIQHNFGAQSHPAANIYHRAMATQKPPAIGAPPAKKSKKAAAAAAAAVTIDPLPRPPITAMPAKKKAAAGTAKKKKAAAKAKPKAVTKSKGTTVSKAVSAVLKAAPKGSTVTVDMSKPKGPVFRITK